MLTWAPRGSLGPTPRPWSHSHHILTNGADHLGGKQAACFQFDSNPLFPQGHTWALGSPSLQNPSGGRAALRSPWNSGSDPAAVTHQLGDARQGTRPQASTSSSREEVLAPPSQTLTGKCPTNGGQQAEQVAYGLLGRRTISKYPALP